MSATGLPQGMHLDGVDSVKVPPHSIEAEQAVLGGLMLDNAAWDQVADRVAEPDFYRNEHRKIFAAIAALAERNDPFDAVTVSEWLTRNGALDAVGGLSYLATLAKDTPSAANIRAYADIVRERAMLRQLISIGGEIADSAFRPEGRSAGELVEEAERSVFEIAERGSRGRKIFEPLKDLLARAVDRIDELFHSDTHITGVPTGFSRFDDLTSGLQKGDLVIIAGRPSMGKTSFAMNIAEHAAIKEKIPTAVFSMEMPGEQLALRLISNLGRVNQSKIRNGRFADDDWPRISSAVTILSEAPMYIDDSAGLTPTELRARARRLKREHGLGLVVVDYLQLMQVPGTKENRATEISEISRGLKALAKELEVPVIALSQLNRSVEQRTDKRPVMSDLRESGAIEQDADVIAFIYREEVYDKDTRRKGIADIIIAKQRNGPIGEVQLTFLGEYTRFENLVSEEAFGDYAPPPDY
ncbi:MAG: replicative DNA helicase [Xanthomonadaceae bacterium]|nr:replicative DNA helicase [Xanthomonadaceae bacterium]